MTIQFMSRRKHEENVKENENGNDVNMYVLCIQV